MRSRAPLLGLLAVLLTAWGAASAQPAESRSLGETLYLPVYSHIWHGDPDRNGQPVKTLLSVSVSIRNTDPANAIRINSAEYFDTGGKKLKQYIPAAVSIAPMGTYELFISRGDDSGGSGANFLISWMSDAPASPPIVEAVHADLPVGRSSVFVTSARPIPR